MFEAIGMGRVAVTAVMALFLGGASAGLFKRTPAPATTPSGLVILAAIVAAILALGPMAGILPKLTPDGVMLASPIFDHSKIAMIDEMIRSGVPVQNPFFSEVGAPDRVAYYYLWHFSAAVFGVLTGVSGWEADAALTWFTAFASLMVMIGLSLRIGGRPSAAIVAVLLAATASLRTTLQWMWPDGTPAWIGWTSGFGGWLFQTSWAPQHIASAMCVVVVCVMLPGLADRQGCLRALVAGIVAAAAFQSSVWVGGIVFTLAAFAIGLYCLWSLPPDRRAAFAIRGAMAAAIAMVLALPFAYDQLSATAMRGSGTLLAIRPVSVLGTALPEFARHLLDVPAYWLIYLPVEFPAFYVAGIIGLWMLVRRRSPADSTIPAIHPAAILAGIGLLTAWLLASTFGDNNDLGWRAILPAIMVLIPAAAALISGWPASWSRVAAVIAAGGVLLSAPETAKIIGENLYGLHKPSGQIFAAAPAMWQAVRRHTPPGERVLDNPLFLADMTPWPVNISWALLADRRSCYAGSELAIPFAPISASAARRNRTPVHPCLCR